MAIDFIIIGSVILSTSFCILYLTLTFYHKSKHMSSIDLKYQSELPWDYNRSVTRIAAMESPRIVFLW